VGFLTFKIDDSRAEAKIAVWQAAARDMRSVYATIGRVLVNRIRLCFAFGVDPWGKPWLPIKWRAPRVSSATGRLTKYGRAQAQANATGKAGQPLVNTGALRSSITQRATAEGVTVGTNKLQAPVHQFGATIGPRNAKRLAFPGPNGAIVFAKRVTIQARPFLPMRRGGDVALPTPWAIDVVRALRAHFEAAERKGAARVG
jgi:phage gpG-like protein